MHVRTPIGKKIIHINKVLLWELERVHVGKVIKLKKKILVYQSFLNH